MNRQKANVDPTENHSRTCWVEGEGGTERKVVISGGTPRRVPFVKEVQRHKALRRVGQPSGWGNLALGTDYRKKMGRPEEPNRQSSVVAAVVRDLKSHTTTGRKRRTNPMGGDTK